MYPLIAAIVVVLFVLLVLARTVKIIPQARAGVVERLGRFHTTLTLVSRSWSHSSTS